MDKKYTKWKCTFYIDVIDENMLQIWKYSMAHDKLHPVVAIERKGGNYTLYDDVSEYHSSGKKKKMLNTLSYHFSLNKAQRDKIEKVLNTL